MVWPALLPPWKRTTMSARWHSQSMILPLPSSPHWAPITVTLAMDIPYPDEFQSARRTRRHGEHLYPLRPSHRKRCYFRATKGPLDLLFLALNLPRSVLTHALGRRVRTKLRGLVKHPVIDLDDHAAILVYQNGIIVHPHPDRAVGRRRQIVIEVIQDPILARPEKRRQRLTPGPAVLVEAPRPGVG